jgi:hypothetical protein
MNKASRGEPTLKEKRMPVGLALLLVLYIVLALAWAAVVFLS